jgi:hypothetical protein
VWRAAVRRFVVLLAGIAGVTGLLSVLGGLLGGGSVDRAVAVGFYLVGSFMLIAGFFIGNRGPVRPKGRTGPMLFGSRIMRWATPLEREESLNESALFVALGFALILIGVAVDSRSGFY